MPDRSLLKNNKRWVVKIGSALLTDDGKGIDHVRIGDWVKQIAHLKAQGLEIVLVSSGAVAAGMSTLGLTERPNSIDKVQAVSAIGQTALVKEYQELFAKYDLQAAQVLLTHDDLSNRTRYLNARNTLKALLEFNVIPIVNENDTVATDEIQFGDNDTLGALVTNLIEADSLIILTDQDGLYTGDPRNNPNVELISQGMATNPQYVEMATGAGALGRGGMSTKIRAAVLSARSGANTIIVGGRLDSALMNIYSGKNIGTLLTAPDEPLTARKQWLAGHLQTKGTLILDKGAEKALIKQGKSLLAVGIKSMIGDFVRGEAVDCLTIDGNLIARGLINYDHKELVKIIGQPSEAISDILGYSNEEEVIHRDNLIVF